MTRLAPTACSINLLARTEWVPVVASTASAEVAESISVSEDLDRLLLLGAANAFAGDLANLGAW